MLRSDLKRPVFATMKPHCRLRPIPLPPETKTKVARLPGIDSRRLGDWTMKFLALAAVIATLVAASAVFVTNHPQTMTACATNCDEHPRAWR